MFSTSLRRVATSTLKSTTRSTTTSLSTATNSISQFHPRISSKTITTHNSHHTITNSSSLHPTTSTKFSSQPPPLPNSSKPTPKSLYLTPLFAASALTPVTQPFIPRPSQPTTPPTSGLIPGKNLSRDLDINYFANEEHYKEDVTYVHTQDIVVNIRQIQRIVMKDTFLCKKYARYMIEAIEDSKKLIDTAEKRLSTMIEVTTHEPTNEIYRNFILKFDAERDALDGYLNLTLLCVMPVANITKHFHRPIDEENNDGGLNAEFDLVQEQFDIVHEQLSQLRDLSEKCDGLVEMTDLCIQEFYQQMVKEIESLEDNYLPQDLSRFQGEQPLNKTYMDEKTLKSSNPWISEYELERIFNTVHDPVKRDAEIEKVIKRNRNKASKAELDKALESHRNNQDWDRFIPTESYGDDNDDY